jgi:hypothetical protein
MGTRSNACLEEDRPPAALTPGGAPDIVLDSLDAFVSEETLPARTSRSHDDAALDAFDLEAAASADPPLPRSTPWRSMAGAAGVVGVIAVGLLVKAPGHVPSPPDAARSSANTTAAETRPPDPPRATALPPMQPPASSIEAPAETNRPLRQNPPTLQVEPAGSAAINGLAGRATDEGVASPAPTTGNVMASSPSLTIDAGIGVVLPAAGPVPEIPPAKVNALLVPDGEPAPLPSEPARSSAEDQVNAVLARFQAGYSRLDAASVQAIWPSVDRSRLERAFRNLEWQKLEFSECRLDVTGAAATAICTGVVEYGTRVGSRRAREARRWTFALQEQSAGWLIQNVLMR